jgi:cytochrome c oxidase subunit 4
MERPHAQAAAAGVPALAAPEIAEHHPKARLYVGVFVILFIITAAEVGVTYIPGIREEPQILIPTLIILAILKFGSIAAFYMHLRFDSRVFSAFFLLGLVIAFGMFFSFLGLFTAHYREPYEPEVQATPASTAAAGTTTSTGTTAGAAR